MANAALVPGKLPVHIARSIAAGGGANNILPATGLQHATSVGQQANNILPTTNLHAVRDIFADPQFGAPHTTAMGPEHNYGMLVTGLLVYGLTMAFLGFWDDNVLPDLQQKGLMPVIPGEMQKLSTADRAIPFLTPITADRHAYPLPAYAELNDRCHRIGSRGEVTFYLCPSDGKMDYDDGYGECKISAEFSKHYGQPVFVCKRKTI